jgi:hypothetical protein
MARASQLNPFLEKGKLVGGNQGLKRENSTMKWS